MLICLSIPYFRPPYIIYRQKNVLSQFFISRICAKTAVSLVIPLRGYVLRTHPGLQIISRLRGLCSLFLEFTFDFGRFAIDLRHSVPRKPYYHLYLFPQFQVMKRLFVLLLALVVLSSHDMFLKFDSFFLMPEKAASLHLYNGTFDRSDNFITRDRMLDVSLVGSGLRERQPDSMWMNVGATTVLNFITGEMGTWVAGVSTAPRSLEMAAEDFNDYLEHDGVLDVLDQRKRKGTIDDDAHEKYSKHVKAIFQIGDVITDDWQVELGYPIEFIPLQNPYELEVGDEMAVRLLRDGEFLADQLVYLGTESHSHSHDEEGKEHTHNETSLRTNAEGIVKVKISSPGKWYFRTIHLVTSEEEDLTHESNWATLTFQIGDDAQVTSDHSHALSLYVWVIGFLLLAIILYLVTRPGRA